MSNKMENKPEQKMFMITLTFADTSVTKYVINRANYYLAKEEAEFLQKEFVSDGINVSYHVQEVKSK